MRPKELYKKIKNPSSKIGKIFKVVVKSILQHLLIIFTFTVLLHIILATSLGVGYEKFKKNINNHKPQTYYYCHDEGIFGSTEPCSKEKLLETESMNRLFILSWSVGIDTFVLLIPDTSVHFGTIPGWIFTLISYTLFLTVVYRNCLKEFKQRDLKLINLIKKYKYLVLSNGVVLYSVVFVLLFLYSNKFPTPNENLDTYPEIDKVYKDFPEISKEFNDISQEAYSKNDLKKCRQLPKVGAYYGGNENLSDWGAYTHVYILQDLCVLQTPTLPYMDGNNAICKESICQLKDSLYSKLKVNVK